MVHIIEKDSHNLLDDARKCLIFMSLLDASMLALRTFENFLGFFENAAF